MVAQRKAVSVWDGDLMTGSGRVRVDSGALPEFAVSWASRTEQPGGKTSPEELLAAAHASCLSMALSAGLARNRTPAQRIQISATCTFDKVGDGWKVTRMDLEAVAWVKGLESSQFDAIAKKAEEGCPITNAIKNNVEITLHLRLQS